MANERNTELIVYNHFKPFEDQIFIELQKSDTPAIDKLFKVASKKGGGKGFPEYIITFKNYPELIIIIECKSSVTKHESPDRDKYAEYAVDGILLYSSFLSKAYDVIAIAVSGETKSKLNVSHFLQLKGEKTITPIFSDKLISVDSYIDGYSKSPEKFRQDYFKLLEFTKELNETLQHHKIEEDKRSLLISSILIALDNQAFKVSYPLLGAPNKDDNEEERKNKIANASKELANLLVDTVINQLKSAKIQEEKLENLKVQFTFIRTDTSLSTKEGILKDFIDSIDKNINSFIRTHEYFDVLSQLYVEFLRYANSDKGLGIVLTPLHITELFADLADVNKNSVVYDNCTGTGGFLISAMKKMILDAKDDNATIRKIKSSQLIGTEYQAKIFALAVSNMYIHQDGKTNILSGSCFDDGIIENIKKRKPTVGFLNPPYKADKKKDTEELEFVLNNLECLVDGGKCVAIVPMSAAVATKTGKIYELKKKLLERHTLEAVLSMPDQLFINSDANVVSCIMVFTAHKAHPKAKETFLGYFKDDGYIKHKTRGRIDYYGTWDSIKQQWLTNYINRKDKAGLSVNKILTPSDEWCAEAYMETDYSILNENIFIENIKKYLAFNLINSNKEIKIEYKKILANKNVLDTSRWIYFNYEKDKNFVFKIKKGKRLTEKDQVSGAIPYVSSSSLNNGINNYIGNGFTDKNCLSFACYGSIGEVFYQPHEAWISDNCNALYLNGREFNIYNAMFIISVLQLEKFRFSYGMTGKKERLQGFKIKLPSKGGKPDWEWMENYIKSLPYSASL